MVDFADDKSFDLGKDYEYILSIRISPDGFSFSVTNTTNNKIVAFKITQLKISDEKFIARRFDEWISTQEILTHKFDQIQIVIFTDKFTLVPESMFSDKSSASTLQNLFENKTPSEIIENKIDGLNVRLLFSISQPLNFLLQSRFKKAHILHPVKLLADNLLPNETGNKAILFLTPGSMYLLLFNKNRLLLANSFVVKHPNDVVYFLLTALKQEMLNPKKTELVLCGEKSQTEETEKVFKNHFESIEKPNFDPKTGFTCEYLARPEYPLFTQLL